jgi:hypothetical protein
VGSPIHQKISVSKSNAVMERSEWYLVGDIIWAHLLAINAYTGFISLIIFMNSENNWGNEEITEERINEPDLFCFGPYNIFLQFN